MNEDEEEKEKNIISITNKSNSDWMTKKTFSWSFQSESSMVNDQIGEQKKTIQFASIDIDSVERKFIVMFRYLCSLFLS